MGNGDGKADLVCDDTAGRHWTNYHNVWGKFYAGRYVLAGWCTGAGATRGWADFNGDGKSDMTCDFKNYHWVQMGLGNTYFRNLGLRVNGWCGHAGSYSQWADINGDGKDDLTCDDSAGRHWYMLSNGNGSFRSTGLTTTGWC